MVDLKKLGLRPEEGLDPAVQESFYNSRQSFDRPIPGESLTNNPDNPQSFEKSPEYSQQTEALEYLFSSITSEDSFNSLLSVIGQGMPIISLTEILLYKGFTEGKWNPDLMLMLIEPTAFMLMALAERSGVEYVVMKKDDEDLKEEEDQQFKMFDQKFQGANNLKKIDSKLSKTSLPPTIVKKLEELPEQKSLMAQ